MTPIAKYLAFSKNRSPIKILFFANVVNSNVNRLPDDAI